MVSAAVILASLGAAPALAQSGHAGHDSHHHGHAPARTTADTDTAAALSEGTVRRVNVEAGSVTIAHGPLANLDMPPMTMSFRLRGNASLDGLAPGDRIRFAADQDGDAFIVTEIEKLGE
jgi:Cu/Ag efflux protein CusF